MAAEKVRIAAAAAHSAEAAQSGKRVALYVGFWPAERVVTIGELNGPTVAVSLERLEGLIAQLERIRDEVAAADEEEGHGPAAAQPGS